MIELVNLATANIPILLALKNVTDKMSENPLFQLYAALAALAAIPATIAIIKKIANRLRYKS